MPFTGCYVRAFSSVWVPMAPPPRSRVQEETGTFLLSALGDDSESEEAENVRQEVLLEFERSEHAAAESLLQIDADASEEDVRGAFAARMEKWDKKLEELDNETTLCLKVDEIKKRLARAKFEMLEQGEPDKEEPIAEASRPKNLESEEKRLLREMKLRKLVDDQEGVISFLYELVRLEPEKAKYEVMLAQALAGHHVMRKKAERHFRRALSLDSQNAKVHYLFGTLLPIFRHEKPRARRVQIGAPHPPKLRGSTPRARRAEKRGGLAPGSAERLLLLN